MNKKTSAVVMLLSLAVFLSACKGEFGQNETITNTDDLCTATVQTETFTTETCPSKPSADEKTHGETEQPHSPLYVDGLSVEEVIRYFNEVCLDAEIVNSGDASLLQKWTNPIYYAIHGSPTVKDIEVLRNFTDWLNTMEGFPGIYETENPQDTNLQIHFCSQQDMLVLMGDDFTNMDGAVTYWYMDNAIYDAMICYRTDLSQFLRNSVILEEIYNGLGPIQDTMLRPNSIIYSEYSEQQNLTAVDELILKLMYHPQIRCGMGADECETVIRQLYY